MTSPRVRARLERRKKAPKGSNRRLLLSVVALAAAIPLLVWFLFAAGIVEAPGSRRTIERVQPTGPPSLTLTEEERELLTLVDKEHGLPSEYAPADLIRITGIEASTPNQRLRPMALAALQHLSAEAQQQGHTLAVSSAYRSYTEQEATYNYWVSRLGPVEAGRISARPGHSEHQLGTTVDLTSPSVNYELVEAFAEKPEGRWLTTNGHRFGFVMSYPVNKEATTGYAYEPWHWRYVGEKVATWLWERGFTLAEWQREGS